MAYQLSLLEDAHHDIVENDGKPSRTYARKYWLKSDSVSFVGCHAARSTFETLTGFSKGTTYHPENDSAVCMSIEISSKSTIPPHQQWDVTVNWTTNIPKVDEEDPSLRRWMRKVNTSEQQRHVFKDRNGNLIVDSAGSPFDGGIPVNVRLPTVTWTHNVDWDSYNLATPYVMSGRLNSDTFMSCEPGTLLLDVAAEEAWEGKWHYVKETITVTYDPLGWQPKPANAGLFEIVGGEQVRCIDATGAPATEPQPLYATGEMIPIANRPADCNFVSVDYYFPLVFSDLGLELS